MKQKRVLTIQDYSCLGRCSLTEYLPVVSSCGIECVGIPTAVLSNHTAGFRSWTYADLTEYLLPTIDHWEDYNHFFDAISSGYLGTDQVDIVSQIFRRLKTEKTILLVDPAFADSGRLYPGFTKEHIDKMRTLLSLADVTLPNLTEACLLTDTPYREDFSLPEIDRMMEKLSSFGPKEVVISGLSLAKGKVGCRILDSRTKTFSTYQTKSYPGQYHGTGDLFASSFLSARILGLGLSSSVEVAHDFVHRSIKETIEEGKPELYYGVEFEKALPYLVRKIKNQLSKG